MKNFGLLKNKLDLQFQVVTELLNLERQKSRVIIDGDVSALDKLTNVEQSLVMKSSAVEEERNLLLIEHGLEKMTISQVIKSFPNARSTGLPEVYRALREALLELQKTSDLNQRLLKTRLDVINYVLSKSGLQSGEFGAYAAKNGRVEEAKEHLDDNTMLNKKV